LVTAKDKEVIHLKQQLDRSAEVGAKSGIIAASHSREARAASARLVEREAQAHARRAELCKALSAAREHLQQERIALAQCTKERDAALAEGETSQLELQNEQLVNKRLSAE
jgi:hypothetical protein